MDYKSVHLVVTRSRSTADSSLPTAHCLLLTAHYQLLTAYC
jgi:hypothetical protein